MRAFIGIDFKQELKHELAELQKSLKNYAVKGRWKYIDNFHLTLKFLGEIDQWQKEQIDNIMHNICIDQKPFSLTLDDLGVFAGRENIRVLWLGLAGDINRLTSLYNKIEEGLNSLGFPREKRGYKPHVTIGQDIVFKEDFLHIRDGLSLSKFTAIYVDRLFLFKSEQIGNKRIYTKISRYPLLGK